MTKTLSLSIVLFVFMLGCGSGVGGGGNVVLLPKPGLPRYQEAAAIPVSGGVVSPAGGNLMLERVDLSIDTRLGTRKVGAVYNTADDAWFWSFDISYNGAIFVDATGAEYGYIWDPTAENRLFPGGHWIRVDQTRVRSTGGLTHEFRSNGTLEAIHWESAAYPRLEYLTTGIAGKQRVVLVRQCLGISDCASVYTVERDLSGRVTALQDRAGRRAEFSYDAEGRLATARDPLDLEQGWPGRRYTWWGQRLVAVTNSEGERTEYETRWSTGQVLTVRQVGTPNRTQRFSYAPTMGARPLNEASRVMFHRDALGRSTKIVVDGHRRVREVHQPSGAITRYKYTKSSFELTSIEHPDGTLTEWEYVAENEIVRTDPNGNQVRMTFRLDDGENRDDLYRRPIERIEDDLGLVEERGYANGRLVWLENGEGERTTLSYDPNNAISSVTLPDGIVVAFDDYAEHGWPETVTVAGETEQRVYDLVGNLLSASGLDVQDTRPGGEIGRTYDGDRNPTIVFLMDAPASGPAVQYAIQMAYRSDGQPLSITRPHGDDHEFVYDATGSRIERRERVDGVWVPTFFEVDRLGRNTAEILPNGMRREVAFNEDGEVAAVRGMRNGTLESETLMTYVDGRLATLDDAAQPAIETLRYDSFGQVAAIDFPDGETLEFGYDLRGRRTLETYRLPGGSTLRQLGFDYDLANRETSVSAGGTSLLQRSYDQGQLSQVAYGNGLSQQLHYDAVTGLLDASFLSHPGQGVVAFSNIQRTLVPGLSAVEIVVDTTTSLATTREQHLLGPDAGTGSEGKRLRASGDGQNSEVLGFDALSNLMNLGSLTLAYNGEHNRLGQIVPGGGGATLAEYSYDAAGYVTDRSGVALAWTAHGRIASIGNDVFEYDGTWRPLRRVVDGVERRFLFGGRVETDAVGVPVRIDLTAVVLELDLGTTRYRHLDYRGNVSAVSDAAGSIVAHYEYDGYGVIASFGNDDGAATFAGGRLLGDLLVLGPRVHDPLAGRFLAPDPIFQLASQFAYTPGNPILWSDEPGLQPTVRSRQAAAQVKTFLGATFAMTGAVIVFFGGPVVGLTLGSTVFGVGLFLLSEGLAEQILYGTPTVTIYDLSSGAGLGALPSLQDAAPAGVAPDPGGSGCSACGDASSGAGTLSSGFNGGLGGFGGFGGGF